VRAVSDGDAHSFNALSEGDKFGPIAHVASALLRFRQQERLQPVLRPMPQGWLRAQCFQMPGWGNLFGAQDFLAFRVDQAFRANEESDRESEGRNSGIGAKT